MDERKTCSALGNHVQLCVECSMPKLKRQQSYRASLYIITVTSVCASEDCARKMALYGSTISAAICGLSFDCEQSFTARIFSTTHVKMPHLGTAPEMGEGHCKATGTWQSYDFKTSSYVFARWTYSSLAPSVVQLPGT